MPVYMLVEIEVTDADIYAEYTRGVPDTVAAYGGRYVVRGGEVIPLSGDWTPQRIVILEFPSYERMWAWNSSEEYRALVPLRMRSARTRAIALDGYAGPPS